MRTRLMLLVLPMLIAGCGESAKTADAPAEVSEVPEVPEVPEETGSAPASLLPSPAVIKFRPGKWQSSSELVALDVPGMTPEVAKATLNQKTSFESCMTPEQAQTPSSDLFTSASVSSCTRRDFTMSGGRISATMVCIDNQIPGERPMTMTIDGTYTTTSYAVVMKSVYTDGQGQSTMKITARASGHRISDCD